MTRMSLSVGTFIAAVPLMRDIADLLHAGEHPVQKSPHLVKTERGWARPRPACGWRDVRGNLFQRPREIAPVLSAWHIRHSGGPHTPSSCAGMPKVSPDSRVAG